MKTYTVKKVYDNGTKEWFLNGKLHREDGPAAEWADGTKFWFLNGKLHREDGPAVEWADGTKCWCRNGEDRREDGPAIEYPNGTKFWYIDDKQLTEAEFNSRNKTCNGKIVTIDGKQYKLQEVK
jgi:hypothetical protein